MTYLLTYSPTHLHPSLHLSQKPLTTTRASKLPQPSLSPTHHIPNTAPPQEPPSTSLINLVHQARSLDITSKFNPNLHPPASKNSPSIPIPPQFQYQAQFTHLQPLIANNPSTWPIRSLITSQDVASNPSNLTHPWFTDAMQRRSLWLLACLGVRCCRWILG